MRYRSSSKESLRAFRFTCAAAAARNSCCFSLCSLYKRKRRRLRRSRSGHIPPGNPGNFHTITVSEKALSAHSSHGDAAGPVQRGLRVSVSRRR